MSEPLVFRCVACGGVNRVDAARVEKGPSRGRCKAALDTSGAPVHLDDAQLEALIAASPVPVLVDFYADWCGPCRAIAPSVAAVRQENRGRMFVVKVDTDRHGRMAGRLGVQGIPALFVFQGRPGGRPEGGRVAARRAALVGPGLPVPGGHMTMREAPHFAATP